MHDIDGEFYCSAGFMGRSSPAGCCGESKITCHLCTNHHRKWPTPEQFKGEYGREWDGAVYALSSTGWVKADIIKDPKAVVCACSPFGTPSDNWRPK